MSAKGTHGRLAGYAEDAASRHGFLLRDGVLNTIDFPGSNFSQANGITDNGVVIGHFLDGNGSRSSAPCRYASRKDLEATA
jgi:hypothetical protein